MPPSPPSRIRGRGLPVVCILLLALGAGCASLPCGPDAQRRALRSVPKVPGGHLRADRALVAAFFTANGAAPTPTQLEEIIPPAAPPGRIDRNAIHRIAARQGRVLMVVKADERFLWEELGNNLPLLILLPPDARRGSGLTPLIPVAWDQAKGAIELLDGNGEIRTLSDTEFFARREPLKQAALCLVRPGKLLHFEPTREQRLLLADFWLERGEYRRADATYAALQEEAPPGGDLDALLGRGNVLVRKGRYRDAIPIYRAALAIDPDNPKILNNLAFAMLYGGGELMAALRHANKAARLEPENPLVLETLGSINLRIGDPTAAAKYLEQAWARALKRSPEVQIAIMDQLVRAWLGANRKDLAWQVAEHRQRTFPNYRFPKDILLNFPALRAPPGAAAGKKK